MPPALAPPEPPTNPAADHPSLSSEFPVPSKGDQGVGSGASRDFSRYVAGFSRHVLGRPLRPYQATIAGAIVESVVRRRGLTFTVMMARRVPA